jgi:hypothetical protein
MLLPHNGAFMFTGFYGCMLVGAKFEFKCMYKNDEGNRLFASLPYSLFCFHLFLQPCCNSNQTFPVLIYIHTDNELVIYTDPSRGLWNTL